MASPSWRRASAAKIAVSTPGVEPGLLPDRSDRPWCAPLVSGGDRAGGPAGDGQRRVSGYSGGGKAMIAEFEERRPARRRTAPMACR
jgi:hypothetical protein